MAPKYALEAVDQLFRDIVNINVPFAGKTIILGGDFRQIPPVVPKASRQEIADTSIKHSSLWKLFQTFSLTENMRANDQNSSWPQFLLQLGNGELPEDENGQIQLPDEIISNGDLIEDVFGDIKTLQDMDDVVDRAILTPKNFDSLTINNEILRRLPGEERVCKSIDEAECDDNIDKANFSLEFINSLTPQGYPPHELRLKKGAVVMLLRNLHVNRGLCNGTRLIVEHMDRYLIGCRVVTGSNKGQYVLIPRITICPSTGDNLPFRLRRRQFPVRLAFAMTINKSQGQTFQRVGIYLKKSTFAHGQLYVACSRVRSMNDLKILLPPNSKKTTNVVFSEMLSFV
jgi:ATP-dependent exoDNAse (exonuclease V) alpha subunit